MKLRFSAHILKSIKTPYIIWFNLCCHIATDYFQQEMENESAEFNIIWDNAKRFVEQGKYDEAIEVFKHIIVQYADHPTAAEYANAYLSDIFLTLCKLDYAIYHIHKALNLNPDYPGYHYILGFIYVIKQQWENAVPEFEQALEKSPGNGEYMRSLGWATFNGGDTTTGLAYLEKARKMDPSNAHVLTDLAVVHMTMFDFTIAKKYAEKAVRLAPNSTIIKDVLERAYAYEIALQDMPVNKQGKSRK